jgi:hypothetical protein
VAVVVDGPFLLIRGSAEQLEHRALRGVHRLDRVLAEAWRGGSRQASLARLLATCDVEPMTEAQARDVGVLAGKAGHDNVVDVTVVEGAIRRRQAVVTANETHTHKIANAARVEVRIERV